MFRICLLLLTLLVVSPVAAREVRLSGPGGEPCGHLAKEDKAVEEPAKRKAAPRRETRIKPTVHSDAGPSSRLQSPRWHSFLPGMFR